MPASTHLLPAHTLAQRARDFAGFTYRISDGTFPRDGFAVAISKGPERELLAAPTPDDIEQFYRDNLQTIVAGNVVFKGGVCLGAWQGADRWYLDLTIVVRSLDEALVLGRQNAQMAVYDLGEGHAIAIPWNPEPANPLAS